MRGGKCGLVTLCVVVMVVLAACGAGGSSPSPLAMATATPTVTPTVTATTAPTPTKPPAKPGIPVATITMGASTFTSTTNVTIKAGQAVTFEDPESGGGFHPLVIGTHGNHMATPGAPDELDTDEGVLFSPGTKMDITFYNPGTFPITCVAHPAMQVTITVTAS